MKTLRYIGMALVAMVLCVGLASCSDDDEDGDTIPTLTELVGSVWNGTTPDGYNVKVTIESATTVNVVVSGNGYNDDSTHNYNYDEKAGTVTFEYDGVDCVGSIRRNSMVINLGEYKIKFKRAK